MIRYKKNNFHTLARAAFVSLLAVTSLILTACGGGSGSSSSNPGSDDPNAGPGGGGNSDLASRLSLGAIESTSRFDIWYCEDGQNIVDTYYFQPPLAGQTRHAGFQVDLDTRIEFDTNDDRAALFTWELNGPRAILITYANSDRQDDISNIVFESDERFRAFSARQGSLSCRVTLFDITLRDALINPLRPPDTPPPRNESFWACTDSDRRAFSLVFANPGDDVFDGAEIAADGGNRGFTWDVIASNDRNPLSFDGVRISYSDSGDVEELNQFTLSDNDQRFVVTSSMRGRVDCVLTPLDPDGGTANPGAGGPASEAELRQRLATTVDTTGNELAIWACVSRTDLDLIYAFLPDGTGVFRDIDTTGALLFEWTTTAPDAVLLDLNESGQQEDLTTIRFNGSGFSANSSTQGPLECVASAIPTAVEEPSDLALRHRHVGHAVSLVQAIHELQ